MKKTAKTSRKKHASNEISESAKKAGRRRAYFLAFLCIALAGVLIYRLYDLQIIRGEKFQLDFQNRIRRTVVTRGERGRILDRNGDVLAESVPSFNITMNDLTDDSYGDDALLNSRILEIIQILDENGGEMVTDFSIVLNGGSFYFKEMGETAKTRFLADVYGYADPADMPSEYRAKTAAEVIGDLADRYGILAAAGEGVNNRTLLKLVIARYNLSLNYYQKYVSTTLAKDVPESTKKAIEERFSSEDDGVQIEEELVRHYRDAQFFSNIVGYTGEASADYLSEHDEKDSHGHPLYREGDTVGLTGIEASQEEILHAVSGQETFNVDNIGRVTEDSADTGSFSASDQSYAPTPGRDVQLTIDRDLQIAAYRIVENNLRSIILSKLNDSLEDQEISEEEDGSKIRIPISNVYASCLCNIIDSNHFTSEEASGTEREVEKTIRRFVRQRSEEILDEITNGRTPWKDLDREMQTYQTLLAQALYDYGVAEFSGKGQAKNAVYKAWEKGETSLYDLVMEAILEDWVVTDSRYLYLYSDKSQRRETYDRVMDFFSAVIGADEHSLNDRDMRNAFYKYLIVDREITPNQVCHLLLDQEIVKISDEELESFESEWGESDYTFMYNRIRDMDLTPAQLHLYPSTASVVVTDPNNGDVLAMVSYPGYDSNRINDETYYRQLVNDPAKPLLNYATQQLTAPGSTFKLVTATAALSEEVVDIWDRVNCKKKSSFKKVKDDPNPPKCWIYPKKHGKQNLEGAIANSCNIYFYEMGYRLGQDKEEKYNSVRGIEKLQKYAAFYGLDSTSGVEISESEPSLLSSDPIRGAIGQDTNAYTTAGLARYVTAIANRGTNYRLTLIDSTQEVDGSITKHEKYIEKTIRLEDDQWKAIHKGMRRVASGYAAFNVLWETPVAGKTGTAQQTGMPDNALFIGYAPYYQPDDWNAEQMDQIEKIAVACRIPNGYSSSYAAQLASDVFRFFYHPDDLDQIVDSIVLSQGSSND